MRPIALLLALMLAVLGFAQSPAAKLRRGDEVAVVVTGFEKFNGEYVVADDGMLTGVGFGTVQAEGKTIDEVREAIRIALKKRIKEPSVELVLKKQTQLVVYVIGGTEKAPIPYKPDLDLRQIIAVAGLVDTPEMTECVVNRKGELTRHVNLPKLLRGDPSEWNGPIQPDDIVSLIGKIFRVSVSGEVVLPGDYPVREDGLIAAIAQARGVTKEGTLQNVLVFRGADVFQVNVADAQAGKPVSFTLKPGDAVVVRKSENAVYILGEVRMPGRYVVPDGKEYRASDLLAAAMGLSNNGSMRRMALVRAGKDGKFVAKQFHLDEFVKDGKMESNPKLQSGDILMFSPQKAAPFASLNQIASTAFLLNGIVKP